MTKIPHEKQPLDIADLDVQLDTYIPDDPFITISFERGVSAERVTATVNMIKMVNEMYDTFQVMSEMKVDEEHRRDNICFECDKWRRFGNDIILDAQWVMKQIHPEEK